MFGGRSPVGAGSSSGPSSASATNGCSVSAGVQRGPSQNCPVRGRYVMFVRDPSATTSTVSPSVAGDQRVRVAVGRMPEHVVDADRVRARVPGPDVR